MNCSLADYHCRNALVRYTQRPLDAPIVLLLSSSSSSSSLFLIVLVVAVVVVAVVIIGIVDDVDLFVCVRYFVVRMLSTAGTGFFYTMRRSRLWPGKFKLVKHDPIGKKHMQLGG